MILIIICVFIVLALNGIALYSYLECYSYFDRDDNMYYSIWHNKKLTIAGKIVLTLLTIIFFPIYSLVVLGIYVFLKGEE